MLSTSALSDCHVMLVSAMPSIVFGSGISVSVSAGSAIAVSNLSISSMLFSGYTTTVKLFSFFNPAFVTVAVKMTETEAVPVGFVTAQVPSCLP